MCSLFLSQRSSFNAVSATWAILKRPILVAFYDTHGDTEDTFSTKTPGPTGDLSWEKFTTMYPFLPTMHVHLGKKSWYCRRSLNFANCRLENPSIITNPDTLARLANLSFILYFDETAVAVSGKVGIP